MPLPVSSHASFGDAVDGRPSGGPSDRWAVPTPPADVDSNKNLDPSKRLVVFLRRQPHAKAIVRNVRPGECRMSTSLYACENDFAPRGNPRCAPTKFAYSGIGPTRRGVAGAWQTRAGGLDEGPATKPTLHCKGRC